MKAATVALIIQSLEGSRSLVEVLSDDREISVFEVAISKGEDDPLSNVREHRERQQAEDGQFADYVEELLSHPFQKPEIREHGIQWLKSKMRIEEYQENETEAARIIARYAMDVYSQDPEKTDFFLAGPTAQVRIRVFVLPQGSAIAQVA